MKLQKVRGNSKESFLVCEFSTEIFFRILSISKNWHVKRQETKISVLNINRRKIR
jgi:hypothetical protein